MTKEPMLAPETRADWEQLCQGLNLPPADIHTTRARTVEMSPELIAALLEGAEEHKP